MLLPSCELHNPLTFHQIIRIGTRFSSFFRSIYCLRPINPPEGSTDFLPNVLPLELDFLVSSFKAPEPRFQVVFAFGRAPFPQLQHALYVAEYTQMIRSSKDKVGLPPARPQPIRTERHFPQFFNRRNQGAKAKVGEGPRRLTQGERSGRGEYLTITSLVAGSPGERGRPL